MDDVGFHHNTTIYLEDGLFTTFRDHIDYDLICCSYYNDRFVKASARCTLAKFVSGHFVKLTFNRPSISNVICTSDQKFLLVDGSYVAAIDLTEKNILRSVINSENVFVANIEREVGFANKGCSLFVPVYHNFMLNNGLFVQGSQEI